MIANILVSHVPIPNYDIGSWNIMFSKLTNTHPDFFTHIICPKVFQQQEGIIYFEAEFPFARHKLSIIDKNCAYRPYFNHIKQVLKQEKYAIVNIIDNTNALFTINDLLKKNGLRNRVKIVFHLHGFSVDIVAKTEFYNAIDTLLVLSKTSYKYQVDNNHAITCKVKQIYNGVDTNLFHEVDHDSKAAIKTNLGLDAHKKYFLWVSQDKPKKGLNIILNAWKNFAEKNANTELLIIGTDLRLEVKNAKFLGRIPNNQLPKFYQAADFYLFSTLCHEGHPLSLTEALMCGNYCIASDIDPIAEILDYGNLGKLVTMPHDPQNWVSAMECAMLDVINKFSFEVPKARYSLERWMIDLIAIINDERSYFASNSK